MKDTTLAARRVWRRVAHAARLHRQRADETNLDVQTIHAIAPDANIVVLTSPVDETEGTIGLPQFLELEHYAISHHLGSIISQSFGASEVTLNDSAGQQEIGQWDAFFKQSTTQRGITFFASSGDNGATDYIDPNETQLSTTPTTSFPPDDPWVTGTGGTTLQRTQTDSSFTETVWDSSDGASGGGLSDFFSTPSYQQSLPSPVQQVLNHRRGVPDVATDADPETGLAIYSAGDWELGGGTSATAPFWAAIAAIANQMAGHSLASLIRRSISWLPHRATPATFTISLRATTASGFTTRLSLAIMQSWGGILSPAWVRPTPKT